MAGGRRGPPDLLDLADPADELADERLVGLLRANAADPHLGLYPIVTLAKQLLNMIGNLV